jgi:hypothetical protein
VIIPFKIASKTEILFFSDFNFSESQLYWRRVCEDTRETGKIAFAGFRMRDFFQNILRDRIPRDQKMRDPVPRRSLLDIILGCVSVLRRVESKCRVG